MAKNIEVIKAFIHGGTKTKTRNLYIDNDKLINYGTTIAERVWNSGRYFYTVNVSKYSQSTTTIQNALQRELQDRGIEYSKVRSVKMGADSLI